MFNLATCRCLVLLGGSFDPPHRAHVERPLWVAGRVKAQGVLFLPAGRPPHKECGPAASGADRLAMLQLALGDRTDAGICTLELERDGPSYTVQTLETLAQMRRDLGPEAIPYLLMGSDMARTFYQWRQPDRILQLARPLVMPRAHMGREDFFKGLPPDLDEKESALWRQAWIEGQEMDVSSSQLRVLLGRAEYDHPLVKGMLAPPVLDYIRAKGIY